jgi:hypothetical protein
MNPLFRGASAATFVAMLAASADAASLPTIVVHGIHIRARDVCSGSASETVLAPSPAPGGSRVLSREEVLAQLPAGTPCSMERSIRVVRKTRRLASAELDGIVRRAFGESPWSKKAALIDVRASAPVEVVDEPWSVQLVPVKFPRRKGELRTQVVAVFASEGVEVGRAQVPVTFALNDDAAIPDVVRGAQLSLVVRQGLVEVSTPAVASTDADIGDVVPVLLRPQGRTVRALVTDSAHAQYVGE